MLVGKLVERVNGIYGLVLFAMNAK